MSTTDFGAFRRRRIKDDPELAKRVAWARQQLEAEYEAHLRVESKTPADGTVQGKTKADG